MTSWRLVLRSLTHYWRTNLAVVAGVAAAVAVLGGALLVGDSVRGTLRDLATQRLGRAGIVIASPIWFREALARDLAADRDMRRLFGAICPIAAVPGAVTAQGSGRRAGAVVVYGVDERFWQFHGIQSMAAAGDRDAFISAALADETGLTTGATALVRVQRPSDVPLESLHGRKDDVGRTLRLNVARVLPPAEMGEFSVRPSQGPVLAVFVPLKRLQTELGMDRRANTLLIAAGTGERTGDRRAVAPSVRTAIRAEDVGVRLRPLPARRAVAVESDAGLISAAQLSAITKTFEGTLLEPRHVLTYIANTIQVGERSVPYSAVTAVDLQSVAPAVKATETGAPPPIVLNEWAARELQAKTGDAVHLDYDVWEEPGRLAAKRAEFRLAAVVPVRPIDQDYVPVYRGISDAATMDAWDPPFPIDLRRVRHVDEAYWDAYRTTPKAYVPLETGQRLWASRFGSITSLRFDVLESRGVDETLRAFDAQLASRIDPGAFGMVTTDVRDVAALASQGATDFGQYFLYFSLFLIAGALVLAALFFKLGVEQRAREVGLLRAVGLATAMIRRGLMTEAACLAVIGAGVGAAASLGYAWLVIVGLRTIWVGAVGTTKLTLHVSGVSVAIGAAAGIAIALACTWWTLRSLGDVSERRLLAGELTTPESTGEGAPARARRVRRAALPVSAAGAVAAAALGSIGAINAEAAFFSAGVLLVIAGLCGMSEWLRQPHRGVIAGRGWWPVSRLGLRNAAHRPGRSVLAIGVIASAVFLIVAVDAFRQHEDNDAGVHSGLGGYDLVVESLLPIARDLSSADARAALNVPALEGVSIAAFRLRPGEDVSCLNLYVPQSPKILGASAEFIRAGRFAFRDSLAATDAERQNPWLLLEKPLGGDVVPVIADANSMTYVLKRGLGDEIPIDLGGRRVRLRFVAALADSVFQRELVMAEAAFRDLFPDREGYQAWLLDVPGDRAEAVSAELERAFSDYGADVTPASARLAEFHRVENTYLATFQALGGLGLLLGTLGLGAVLLRNALERRRELALLGAVGFRRRHFVLMLMAESAALLLAGLVIGAAAASLAVAPALAGRSAGVPVSTTGLLLVGLVLIAGLVSTLVAARVATRAPLLGALRAE